jgi:hypothetical protein
MINYETGEVTLGSLVLSPSLTRETFRVSPAFAQAQELSSNEQWVCYSIRFGQGDVLLDFEGEKLFSIMIGFHLPDENVRGGWETWSQEKEKKRKQLHDQILREELGSISRKFRWGKVGSIADPKTCDASIYVHYVEEQPPAPTK